MRASQRNHITYFLLLAGAALLLLQSCMSSRAYGCHSDMNHAYRSQGR